MFAKLSLLIALSLFPQNRATADINNYQQAKSWLNSYREEKIQQIKKRVAGYRLPSAPFALLHGGRTTYSILLIHGLNDSPYYMKDIAKVMYELGFNVVTVLLPGHGIDPVDMRTVSYLDWYREVQQLIGVAKHTGESFLIGGFSTGGTLSLISSLSDEHIKGMMLFAPAIRLNNLTRDIQFASCTAFLQGMVYESSADDTPVKYQERSLNGVCQLYKLIEMLLSPFKRHFWESNMIPLRRMAESIKVPTFLALTQSDNRLDSVGLVDFGRHIHSPHKIIYFANQNKRDRIFDSWDTDVYKVPSLTHSQLVLESNEFSNQWNPYFFVLKSAIRNFIEGQFPDPGRSRDVEDK